MTKRRIATLLACAAVSGLIASVGQLAWSQGQSVITTLTSGYYLTVDPGPGSAYTPKISAGNFWTALQGTPFASQVNQQAGTGTGTFLPSGKIYGTVGTTGALANGTMQGVGTYTMPANSLSSAGKRVHITAAFNHGANPGSTVYQIWFGQNGGLNDAGKFISATDSIVSNNALLELWVTQTGTSNFQLAWGQGILGTTNVNMIGTSGLLGTTTGDIVIQAACGRGATNNICFLQDMEVDFVN